MKLKLIVRKGGKGSGFRGHVGRPGKVGGSAGGKREGGLPGTKIVIDNTMRGLSYKPYDTYTDSEGKKYRVDRVISSSRLQVTPILSVDEAAKIQFGDDYAQTHQNLAHKIAAEIGGKAV